MSAVTLILPTASENRDAHGPGLGRQNTRSRQEFAVVSVRLWQRHAEINYIYGCGNFYDAHGLCCICFYFLAEEDVEHAAVSAEAHLISKLV